MAIEAGSGDLLKADAQALVNPVNCEGVMGKGLALAFKQTFPANFKAYKRACNTGVVVPGRMFVVELHADCQANPRWIVNFPTKRSWRNKSRIEDIASGLDSLVVDIETRDITSIAIPALGCGLGGLDWNDVRPLIERAMEPLRDVRVLVFAPAQS